MSDSEISCPSCGTPLHIPDDTAVAQCSGCGQALEICRENSEALSEMEMSAPTAKITSRATILAAAIASIVGFVVLWATLGFHRETEPAQNVTVAEQRGRSDAIPELENSMQPPATIPGSDLSPNTTPQNYRLLIPKMTAVRCEQCNGNGAPTKPCPYCKSRGFIFVEQ